MKMNTLISNQRNPDNNLKILSESSVSVDFHQIFTSKSRVIVRQMI
ncbi:hypothetical protein Cycma_0611 [Cyclobacterium marinum DSM 745]|uniref:Uncharacterized protein n=1 Tax=Cyclobacterium marinum (strain ATCC 25205 / DSM 745 / LMG 13164 / NCIMB 1802) TaxID=880070 RepID=G0IZB3_CYCMS|nr:hypothetical protein Cycma_0611 [Cyclobacterium marinum DSM 745]